MAEFFQISDFPQRAQETRGRFSYQQVAKSAEITAQLEDYQARLKAQRENEAIVLSQRAISKGAIQAQDRKARADLSRESKQLTEYEIFANLATQQERMAESIDAIKADITALLLPAIEKIVGYLPIIVDYAKQAIEWFAKVVAAIKKLKFWG